MFLNMDLKKDFIHFEMLEKTLSPKRENCSVEKYQFLLITKSSFHVTGLHY